MSTTAKNQLDVLEAAALEAKRGGTYRPLRGQYTAARRLERRGYLKEAGTSAMWPHYLFVITAAGERVLAEYQAREALK
jgi:hypothetical protein